MTSHHGRTSEALLRTPKDLIQQLPFLAQLVHLRAKPGRRFFGGIQAMVISINHISMYKYIYIYVYVYIDIDIDIYHSINKFLEH